MSDPQGTIDFFISYRGARTDWALWVNWVVRSAGYSTILMDEFPVGTNWTDQMRDACDHCRRLIPLYSEDYWDSGACRLEFDTYLAQHVKNGKARFLLPLVVQECDVHDMEGTLLRKPIHPLTRDAAHAAILGVLKGIDPASPSASSYAEPEPPFPGIASTPTTVADWPESVDSLKWPLADHEDARLAFAELVARSASFRFLAIKGSSETGKSHLTQQFFNNGQRRVTDCHCARFNFKGKLDDTFATFVEHLKVSLRQPSATASAPSCTASPSVSVPPFLSSIRTNTSATPTAGFARACSPPCTVTPRCASPSPARKCRHITARSGRKTQSS